MAEIGIPQEKEGEEQKRVVPPKPQKEIQVFRVLKFRVFGGVFLVSYRKHHH